ncbi:MAG: hypothetical protein Q8L39_10590 [Burkholderiales bacterium]|nr:hypothetical protein [Burkholderiales bacterium]
MRLPPKARALFDLRRRGRIPVPGPFGHVSVLPDWGLTVAGAYVIAPPSIDPSDLDFCFCAGLTVAIFCRLAELSPVDTWLYEIILAVMDADPASIAVIDLDQAAAGLDRGLVAMYVRRAGNDR